jgi:hypothetical protein
MKALLKSGHTGSLLPVWQSGQPEPDAACGRQ